MHNRTLQTSLIAAIGITVFLTVILYWAKNSSVESSSHSVINGTVYQITPQVSGKVMRILVSDNQHVKKDDLLFELDPTLSQLAINHAKAQLAEAKRFAQTQQAVINDAMSLVEQRNQELQNAKVALNKATHAQLDIESAKIRVITSQAMLKAAKDKLESVRVAALKDGHINEKITYYMTELNKAEWLQQQSKITAPGDGIVANLSLHPGQMVSANTPLFNIISAEHPWIEALFDQNQIHRIQKGQTAKIHIEAYPNRTFHGIVESIAGITSSDSNVEVRIRLTDNQDASPLRIGTPAIVKINVNSSL